MLQHTIRKGSLLFVMLTLFVLVTVSCDKGENRKSLSDDYGEDVEIDYAQLRDTVQYLVDSTDLLSFFPQTRRVPGDMKEELRTFYKENDYKLVWNEDGLTDNAQKLLEWFGRIESDGLDSGDFNLQGLRQQIDTVYDAEEFSYRSYASLDVMLSAYYLALARQIGQGRFDPKEVYRDWYIRPKDYDLSENLKIAIEKGVDAALEGAYPDFKQYSLLKKELERYRKIAEKGGWPELPEGKDINPGDSSTRVPLIKQRLAIEGYFDEKAAKDTSRFYSEDLVKAVIDYKEHRGLQTDSTITNELISVFNVPAEHRVEQIVLNMERIRWLPDPLGNKYLMVNVPEFKMRIMENEEPVLEMKVIVGESVNTTPIFSDSMEYVVFAPYWNVPSSIALKEILPYAKKDPSYVDRKHFEIVDGWAEDAKVISPYSINWSRIDPENFPYRIRQKPGHWNSLGKVKFIFPNNTAIYLHDTPADYLFKKSERDFSHGCIRVERPFDLAKFLLPDYSSTEINRLMNNDREEYVSLERKLPVFIFYLTALVDENGKIKFFKDIYNLDDIQLKKLKEV